MPKKKIIKVEQAEKTAEDVKTEPAVEVLKVDEKVENKVIYENAVVTEILEKGDRFYHCKLSDRTTKHVPAHLF